MSNRNKRVPACFPVYERIAASDKSVIIDFFLSKVGKNDHFRTFCKATYNIQDWNPKIVPIVRAKLTSSFSIVGPKLTDLAIDILVPREQRDLTKRELASLFLSHTPEVLSDCKGNLEASIKLASSVGLPGIVRDDKVLSTLVIAKFSWIYYDLDSVSPVFSNLEPANVAVEDTSNEPTSLPETSALTASDEDNASAMASQTPVSQFSLSNTAIALIDSIRSIAITDDFWEEIELFVDEVRAAAHDRAIQLRDDRNLGALREEVCHRLNEIVSYLQMSADAKFLDNGLGFTSITSSVVLQVNSELSHEQIAAMNQSLEDILDLKMSADSYIGRSRVQFVSQVDQLLSDFVDLWKPNKTKLLVYTADTEDEVSDDCSVFPNIEEVVQATDIVSGGKPHEAELSNATSLDIYASGSSDNQQSQSNVVAPDIVGNPASSDVIEDATEPLAKSDIIEEYRNEGENPILAGSPCSVLDDSQVSIHDHVSPSELHHISVPDSTAATLSVLFTSGRVRFGSRYASKYGVTREIFSDTRLVDLIVDGSLLSSPTSLLNDDIRDCINHLAVVEESINHQAARTLLWVSLIIPTMIGRTDVRHLARPLIEILAPSDRSLELITEAISNFIVRTDEVSKSDFATSEAEVRQLKSHLLSAKALQLKEKLQTKNVKYAAGTRMLNKSVTGRGLLGQYLDGIAKNDEQFVETLSKEEGTSLPDLSAEGWIQILWSKYSRNTDRPIEGGPREDCRRLLSEVEALTKEWVQIQQGLPAGQSEEIRALKQTLNKFKDRLPIKTTEIYDHALVKLIDKVWDSVLLVVSGEVVVNSEVDLVFRQQDDLLFDYTDSLGLELPIRSDQILETLQSLVIDRSVDEYRIDNCIKYIESLSLSIDANDYLELRETLLSDRDRYRDQLVATCYELIGKASTAYANYQLSDNEKMSEDRFSELVNAVGLVRDELQLKNGMSTSEAFAKLSPYQQMLEDYDQKYKDKILRDPKYLALSHSDRQIVDDAISHQTYHSVHEMVQSGDVQQFISQRDSHPWFLSRYQSFLELIRQDILGELNGRNISDGSLVSGIQFPSLNQEIARRRATVLKSWVALKKNEEFRIADCRGDIETILKFVDIDQPTVDVTPNGISRSVKVTLKVNADKSACPNPYFGSWRASSLGTATYSVNGSWGIEEIGSVVNKLPTERPVILCYFNVLKLDKRNRLLQVSSKKDHPPIVIDTSLIVFLLTLHPDEVKKAFYDCVTAYAPKNPYTDKGSLASEMFYGRTEAIEAIMQGSACLVYGGRQLGKTALLKRVEYLQSLASNKIAIYLDLKEMGFGSSRLMSEFDSVLARELKDKDVSFRGNDWEKGVINWLEDKHEDNRDITLLLDEADVFLKEDDQSGFRYTLRFHRLMKQCRRFKVVLAGLHNVYRMTTSPNHPLGQLGQPICVGPLLERNDVMEARELVKYPLRSVGVDISDQLTNEILAQTNFYPSLIQMYCHQIVAGKIKGIKSVPVDVTPSDLKQAYDSTLRLNIAHKFALTLGLDIRYKYLTLIIAFLSSEDDQKLLSGIGIHEIRQESLVYWSEKYQDQLGGSRLTILLDELVGLGVLRVTNNKFALRTINIVPMLGGLQQIEDELLSFTETATVAELRDEYYLEEDSKTYDPISRWQYRHLAQHDVKVILGLPAAGVSNVFTHFPQRAGFENSYYIKSTDLSGFRMELNSLPLRFDSKSLVIVPDSIMWNDEWIAEAHWFLNKTRDVQVKGSRTIENVNCFPGVLFVGTSKQEFMQAYSLLQNGEWNQPTDFALVILTALPTGMFQISESGATDAYMSWVGLPQNRESFTTKKLLSEFFELSFADCELLAGDSESLKTQMGSKLHRLGVLFHDAINVKVDPIVDELIINLMDL